MASSQDPTMKQAPKFTAVATPRLEIDLRTRHRSARSASAELKKSSRQRNAGYSRTSTRGANAANHPRSSQQAEKETQQFEFAAEITRQKTASERENAADEGLEGAHREKTATEWNAGARSGGKFL